MKKFLLPLTFLATATQASVQMIPKFEIELRKIEREQAGNGVLRKSKTKLNDGPASSEAPDNWFNLAPADGVEGLSTELVYQQVGEPINEVIVAVIDSGVDVNHEDLQGKIWINTKEIADNNQDDDGNGYVDDVFGWNFIGGAQGMGSVVLAPELANGIRLVKGNPANQITADSLEVTREVVRLRALKERLEQAGQQLDPVLAAQLARDEQTVTVAKANADTTLARVIIMQEQMTKNAALLRAAGMTEITVDTVRAFMTTDPALVQAKQEVLGLLTRGYNEERLQLLLEAYTNRSLYHYNVAFDPRSIVGDDYTNQNERVYGNNDVIGPDSGHGTHVSGIIAADRDNNLGIKGVSSRVKIMALRVVPDGDERDKDVANAIRYAVNNGAKIINMSFGKSHSPFKSVVDRAVAYASSKGVLLVHAAGNSSQNNDTAPNFPNRKLNSGIQSTNWLEVGASAFQKSLDLPAEFSNFGKFSVDIFAPGVDILSTVPDNKYDTFSGTSMASPATAGVAALILGHDDKLTMAELRALIVDTGRRHPRLKVYKPGGNQEVLFSDLSITGSLADAFEAVSAIAETRK